MHYCHDIPGVPINGWWPGRVKAITATGTCALTAADVEREPNANYCISFTVGGQIPTNKFNGSIAVNLRATTFGQDKSWVLLGRADSP